MKTACWQVSAPQKLPSGYLIASLLMPSSSEPCKRPQKNGFQKEHLSSASLLRPWLLKHHPCQTAWESLRACMGGWLLESFSADARPWKALERTRSGLRQGVRAKWRHVHGLWERRSLAGSALLGIEIQLATSCVRLTKADKSLCSVGLSQWPFLTSLRPALFIWLQFVTCNNMVDNMQAVDFARWQDCELHFYSSFLSILQQTCLLLF